MIKEEEKYFERFRNLWHTLNPLNLLTFPRELEELKKKKAIERSEKDEFKIRSMVHPETGETILLPFRMAAVVPTNLGVVLGMLTARTPGSILFWQCLNQSLNVAVNHANSNKSTAMTKGELLLGYTTAVASSCAVAIGMNWLAAARNSALLRAVGPVLATSLAGVLNVLMIRRGEVRKGIAVFDEGGRMLGYSREAAYQALAQVCMTRVLTAVTVLTIPQLVMRGISQTKYRIPIQLAVIGATLQVALPASLAVYPQTGSFFSKEHDCQVFFNKGL